MENYATPEMQVQPVSLTMCVILTPLLSPRPDVFVHFVFRPQSSVSFFFFFFFLYYYFFL